MKRSVQFLLIGVLLSYQAVFATDCTYVAGEFEVWNGWPPALRLTDSTTGITYGVAEDSPLPRQMEKEVESKHSVKGKFCVQTLKVVTVPYQVEPITLVKVVAYAP